MRSTSRGMSRPLIAVVGVTLVLGLIFWAYNLGKGSAAKHVDAANARLAAAGPVIDPVVQPAKPGAKPAVNSVPAGAGVLETPTAPTGAAAPAPLASNTPTQNPSTRPVTPAMLAALDNRSAAAALPSPTTKPAGGAALASSSGSPAPGAGAAAGDATTRAAVASATFSPTGALAEAKQKFDQKKYVDARRSLNAAMSSGALSAEDTRAAKQLLNQVNAVVVFSPVRLPDDELVGTFRVPPGGALARIAARFEVTPELLMRVNDIREARKLKADQDIKVLKGPFHAVVYKNDYLLELWQGDPASRASMYITSFPVGLGANDTTPTGVWAVANKLPNPTYYSPRGEGVVDADDPKNPLGEHWIGLVGTDGHAVGKSSYGIHGTIEPDTIGKQASMGCIRLRNEDVARVYEMLVEGKSTVTVRD